VVLIVAICPQTVFFVVARVARYSLVGVDLLDLLNWFLVESWRGDIVTGAIPDLVGRHLGQKRTAMIRNDEEVTSCAQAPWVFRSGEEKENLGKGGNSWLK
jgi:hypothetical protein